MFSLLESLRTTLDTQSIVCSSQIYVIVVRLIIFSKPQHNSRDSERSIGSNPVHSTDRDSTTVQPRGYPFRPRADSESTANRESRGVEGRQEGSEERGRGKGPGVLRDGDDPQQRATNDGEQEAHRKGAEGDLRAPKRYTQKVYLHRPIHFGVYNRLIETIIIIISSVFRSL